MTDPLEQIDQKYMVNLKGKWHPTYPGVLAAAMANGLRELTVKLLQAPTEDNGQMAIAEATAVFCGPDGRDRIFVEIGDADPKNTGPMIAPHRVRMSATRAKGRALRDALGIGVALREEIHGDEDYPASSPQGQPNGAPPVAQQPLVLAADQVGPASGPGVEAPRLVVPEPVRSDGDAAEVCAVCQMPLTKGQVMTSKPYGRLLCPAHQRASRLANNPAV